MNIKITEYKEVEADLSEASFDEIETLFIDFMEELYTSISQKKFKKLLKSAEQILKDYRDEVSLKFG